MSDTTEQYEYRHSCGCYRRINRDERGRIVSIDEAMCKDHLRTIWDDITLKARTGHSVHAWTIRTNESDSEGW